MAFYVKTNEGFEAEWHLNSEDRKPNVLPNTVIYFQASGDELSYLGKRFTNLTYANSVSVWRRDMAEFIFENL